MSDSRRDSILSRILPWLTLVMLPLAVFWEALFLRGAFFILDAMILNYPLRSWAASRMLAGELPLWCPEIACGFPLFAEGQAGVLYLPNWPFFALLPAHHAAAYSTIFHFILAGLFTFGYLRALRCRPAAALLGALAFQWGGMLVLRGMFLNMINVLAWLPALFWLAERWLARPEKRRGTVLMMMAAVLAVLLAGHPQAAAYVLGFWWLYVLGRALPLLRAGWPQRRALAVPLLLVPLAGVGMGAVQLLPTLELTRSSTRVGGIPEELLMHSSLPPTHLAAMVLPGLFGEPGDGSWRSGDDGFYWELLAWPGIVPLFLALLAALALRAPPARFHACATLATLLLAMGKYTFFGKLLVWLPLLQNFRIPARFLLLFGFSMAVLAGLGLDALLAAAGDRKRLREHPALQRASGLFITLLAACIAMVTAVNGSALLRPGSLLGGWLLLRDLLFVPMLAVAFGLLILNAHRLRRGPSLLAAGAVLLTLLDLGLHGWDWNRTIDPGVYRASPRTVCLAAQEIGGRGRQRVAGLVDDLNSPLRWHDGWDETLVGYKVYFATLHMYGPAAFGLETACYNAWSPLQIRRYRELNRLPLDRLLDLTGVALVTAPRMPNQRYEPLLEERGFTLYRNPDPLPRVMLVHRARLADRMPKLLGLLADPLFDPWNEIIIKGPDGESRRLGSREAVAEEEEWTRVQRYEDRLVEVEFLAASEGWLFLGDTWYQGWTAELDGRPVPILRANAAFRALRVPAGRHRAVFRFRPASVTAGFWISGLSLLLLLPAVMVLAGRGPQAPLPAADPAAPPPGRRRACLIGLAVILLVLAASVMLKWPLWMKALEGLRLPPA